MKQRGSGIFYPGLGYLQFKSKLLSAPPQIPNCFKFFIDSTFSRCSQHSGPFPTFLIAHIVGMPSKFESERTDSIRHGLEDNMPHDIIATCGRCTTRTVRRFKKSIIDNGTVRPPKSLVQGRPRALTAAHEDVCLHKHQFIDVRKSSIGSIYGPQNIWTKSRISCGIHGISWYHSLLSTACCIVANGVTRRYGFGPPSDHKNLAFFS
jgi:hypothetical protein